MIEATGADLLEERVDMARDRTPGATFLACSATAMPLDTASFGLVTAITLFSSLPTHELEAMVASEVARVLRPGGWLVWYDLRVGNPSNAAVHGLSSRRIGELFPGWRRELTSITLVPPVARRLGRTTPVLYPLMHALPLARTHLVGRLQRPS